MTMITLPGSGVGGEGRRTGAVQVCETYWGYEIRDREDRFDRETLAEIFLKFLAVVCAVAAYGQWFLPQALVGGETVTMKAVLSVGFGAAGIWLWGYARRGFSIGTDIDLARREIRVVRRNARGDRSIEAAYPMARAEAAEVEPGGSGQERAALRLRLRAPEAVLQIATGDGGDMALLAARLGRDIRPARERIDEKLAGELPFRSRRAD